ncbi:MAG: ImuA family protein [Kiloniellaceae bacterium]
MSALSTSEAPTTREASREAGLAALRARIRALEVGAGGAGGRRVLPLGVAALDRHLPGGGLPLACLHEIEGARAEWDDGAATGFCLALLARLSAAAPGRAPILWVGCWRDLYAPGLAAFGLDPGRLILVRAGGEADVLWAMEEGLRCADLAAVVGEVETLERCAGRRLQLAAEAGGVTAFLLRRRLRPARRAPAPSSALTRWRAAPARSATLACPAGEPLSGAAVEKLPGRPRWAVELLRCRGAAPGQWLVEWDDATGGFALAAALRDGSVAPESTPAGARGGGMPGARMAG